MRLFPLSNWTKLDVWPYIERESIPMVPLYPARERPIVRRDGTMIIDSTARTVPEVIQQMLSTTFSERQGRLIDFDEDGSMERKKREGYF